MTHDETRDELARMDGWKHIAEPTDEWDVDTRSITMYPEHWIHASTNDVAYCHPHPATLDGANAAVPEGYEWERTPFEWLAWKHGSRMDGPAVKVDDTGNPMADLYALALACRRAMEEKTDGK